MSISQQLSEWGFLIGCIQSATAFMAVDGVMMALRGHGDQAGLAVVWAVVFAAVLAVSLAIHARDSGYSRAWCLLAPLGVVGVLVVHCLPDRSARPARGFPVEPVRTSNHGEP